MSYKKVESVKGRTCLIPVASSTRYLIDPCISAISERLGYKKPLPDFFRSFSRIVFRVGAGFDDEEAKTNAVKATLGKLHGDDQALLEIRKNFYNYGYRDILIEINSKNGFTFFDVESYSKQRESETSKNIHLVI